MKRTLDECCEVLAAEVDRFPWSLRSAYVDWLAQTYYYVLHSTRLLATAAGRFEFDERGQALHHRFATHIGEEKKHELLALHDLKVLGAELLPERHSTRMFYEPQYYKIERNGPIGLFGYIMPLEAIGPLRGKQIMTALLGAFGEKCVSFLKLHAQDDVEHLEKALASLESASPRDRTFVEENMRQTTFAYCQMLREIRSHTS